MKWGFWLTPHSVSEGQQWRGLAAEKSPIVPENYIGRGGYQIGESNMQTVTYYCGIDPGLTGSVCLVGPGGDVGFWTMPWAGGVSHQRPHIDARAFKEIARNLLPIKDNLRLSIEDVWARKIMGANGKQIASSPQSQFTFGWTLGAIQMPLEVLGFDIIWTTPQRWRKAIEIKPNASLIKHAAGLYPDVRIKTKDEASALLIAHATKLMYPG